jgi:molybdopterin converting factor small subunit
MTTVRIPPVLHTETDGKRDVEIAGDTVRDVLAGLLAAFPGLQDRLMSKGELHPFINLYVDGTDVDALDGLDTMVEPSATLLLLPAMAGGCIAAPSVSGSLSAVALYLYPAFTSWFGHEAADEARISSRPGMNIADRAHHVRG